MGKVVNIETSGRRKKSRGRKRPSKTAVVLGGGGFTGGVYEIGALRALDLLAVNSTVNDFDIYVGTSAGAMAAAATFGETYTEPPSGSARPLSSEDMLFDTPDGQVSRTFVTAAGAGLIQVTAWAPTALEAEWRSRAALRSRPEEAGMRLWHGGVVVSEDGATRVVRAG